jgi:hypothetical protein
MKAYMGVNAEILALLTPVLFRERSASGLGGFTQGEIFPYV